MIQKEFNLGSWSENDYRNEPSNINSIFLLIEYENRIVGFLVARVSVSDVVECDLLNFAISSNYQSYGFGQRLFNKLTDQTEFKDVQAIWLEVRLSNQKAVEFYFRRNFRFVQIRKNFYTNPVEDALVLRLQIEKGN